MISFIACSLSIAALSAGVQGGSPYKVKPTGTFLQWYLAEKWGDAEWNAEFAAMKQAGMDTLILTPAVQSKTSEAFYSTSIPGLKLAKGFPDVFDLCLRNAEKERVKIYVGLNANEDWWQKSANEPAWLFNQMELGNKIADDLYRLYKHKYPHAMYGWYWDWEADNENFKTQAAKDTLAQAMKMTMDKLNSIDPKMPMLFCPFMGAWGSSPKEYGELWKYIFPRSGLRKGDKFCPQDSVGAGGATLETYAPYFAAFREAVAVVPGLELWSDMETFYPDDTAASLDRVSKQLMGVQPCVDGVVTFAYSHFYSPVSNNKGWQKAYITMLKKGPDHLPVLDVNAPIAAKIEVSADGKKATLSWIAQPDDGYEVMAGDKVLGHAGPPKPSRAEGARETYLDENYKPGTVYKIRAYDYYGNRSRAVEVKG